jgi:hypothetical protein
LSVQSAFASGSFTCTAETYSGIKFEVFACVPHSIPGLCGDVTVNENGKELFVVSKENVPSFYLSDDFFGLIGMDESFIQERVKLEYIAPNDKRNKLEITTVDGKSYKFKDVTCEMD